MTTTTALRGYAACLTAALALSSAPALAAYPERPINMIVPTAPGGGNDSFARIVGQKMGELLGQTIIVTNRPGAQGAIASDYVARQAPDGYTIMLGYIATHGINPALQKLNYDPIKDFTPIGMLAASPTLLVVPSSLGVNTVAELIDYLKKNAGKANYASAGAGTAPHVSAEVFKQATGVDMLHVPYKGSAPAMTDTMAGITQVMFPSLFGAYSHVQAGKVKALGLAGDRRSPQMPDVPTLTEQGIKGVEVPQWYAIFGPAGMDDAVADKLNSALNTALKDPEIAKKIEAQGAEVRTSTRAELDAFVKSEAQRWREVVAKGGLSAD